jgi:hypothetical protein
MKVKDLEIGMLLCPADDGVFLTAFNDEMIVVGYPPSSRSLWSTAYYQKQAKRAKGKIAIYMGQRKDLNIKKQKATDWANRFVLVEGKIYPVDTHEWKKIRPAI